MGRLSLYRYGGLQDYIAAARSRHGTKERHSMARLRLKRGIVAAAIVSILAVPLLAPPSPNTQAAPAMQAGDKLVLAFYYIWYGPNDFDPRRMPNLPATPYISDHQDVIERQVSEAKQAGIDAFISSWTGTGTETDVNFPKLLDVAQKYAFKATIHFE